MTIRNSLHWTPLITGEAAAAALEAVEAIAKALTPEKVAELSTSHRRSRHWPEQEKPPSLGNGAAGFALFFAYLSRHVEKESYAEAAATWMDEAVDQLSEIDMNPWFFGGFSGVAWVSQHLEGRFFEADDEDEEDPNDEIDTALLELVSRRPWDLQYDLILGLVGIGVYLLERLPRATAARGLAEVVHRLAELAEPAENGHRWLTRPELMLQWQRELAPEGYYNLGAAHGMPAVIALLAGACRAGVAVPTARPLMESALSWFLSTRLPEGRGSAFTSWIPRRGGRSHPSRLAWCYGDAGIAGNLWAAGEASQEPAWQAEALSIARFAARRPIESTGVVDSCLCHGTAGLLQIFNRLYQATGEETLQQAARFWFQKTLAHRETGQGVGGFWTMIPVGEIGAAPQFEKAPTPDFLEGASGVGLALLAAISEVPPDWDRCLMLSLRDVRGAGKPALRS